jgi:hypothetical protein
MEDGSAVGSLTGTEDFVFELPNGETGLEGLTVTDGFEVDGENDLEGLKDFDGLIVTGTSVGSPVGMVGVRVNLSGCWLGVLETGDLVGILLRGAFEGESVMGFFVGFGVIGALLGSLVGVGSAVKVIGGFVLLCEAPAGDPLFLGFLVFDGLNVGRKGDGLDVVGISVGDLDVGDLVDFGAFVDTLIVV